MAAASSRQARRETNRGNTARKAPRGARRAKGPDLDLRRTPVQARGQATFERILDTTADLLESVGVEVLTTNLIAKSAGVNVATLYQYFPNKQAVLLALFERQSAARFELGERYIAGLGNASDWRRHLRSLVQGVARGRTSAKGVVALRQAMRSSPDLQAHDRAHWQKLSATLATELGRAGLRGEKAAIVARSAIETLAALLDFWTLESGAKDPRIIEQIESMLAGYLGPYFERRRGKAAGRA
jgi:AcrR family transcriptional regulator